MADKYLVICRDDKSYFGEMSRAENEITVKVECQITPPGEVPKVGDTHYYDVKIMLYNVIAYYKASKRYVLNKERGYTAAFEPSEVKLLGE